MPRRLIISVLIILIIIFILVDIAIYGFVAYKYWQKSSAQSQTGIVLSTIITNNYKDPATGITFQYPDSLTYASFQIPKLIVTAQGSTLIDANDCLPAQASGATDSKIAINGMNFCLSVGSQKTSGAIIYSYYYTILKNQNYYTLEYTVATLSGCDAFVGTPQYQYCINDLKNYNNTVIPLIQNSVSTLTFPN